MTAEQINPAATETWYDGVDQNCDDLSDYDADSDGYGHAEHADAVLTEGLLTADDCLEGTEADVAENPGGVAGADANPAATETWYDGTDQNCDDLSDYDADADGHDAETYGGDDCLEGTSTDVDDNPGGVAGVDANPGALETWYDGTDQNCDDLSDYDADADGYGHENYDAEVADEGLVETGDCNDTIATSYPGAAETAYDGVDADCDDSSDYDADGDGYASNDAAYAAAVALEIATGKDILAGDCDDTSVTTRPDLATNEANPSDCMKDDDADGWGDDSPGTGVNPGSDCDDENDAINPDASEIWYDGIDDDCEPTNDDDADGDGYAATGFEGGLYGTGDCDDTDPAINPAAIEECEYVYDGSDPVQFAKVQIDDDCDGNPNTQDGEPIRSELEIVYYQDNDRDGYGAAADIDGNGKIDSSDNYALCELEDGYSSSFGDCNDANPEIHPGAEEICNNLDDDCDDQIDEANSLGKSSGCITLYADQDMDGYGDTFNTACMCWDGDAGGECVNPEGREYEYDADTEICYTQVSGDCYDYDATIKPYEGPTSEFTELIDGHDNDCDGYVPIVELDCDDDGALPTLPSGVTNNGEVSSAEDAGVGDCNNVEYPEFLTCWNEFSMRLTCDERTGLLVVALNNEGATDRYNGGRRFYDSSIGRACVGGGDCDDLCAARCPDIAEACDGIDNDCNDSADFAMDSNNDGIPDSMEEDVVVGGYVHVNEIDIDADGYLGCAEEDLLQADQTWVSGRSCMTNSLLSDCNNRCFLSSPASEEERCNAFLDVCGGEDEGTEADRDSYETCGAWGSSDSAYPEEDFFVLVYYESGDVTEGIGEATTAITTGTDTGATDTGATDTGATDTGSADTGATGDSGTPDTAAARPPPSRDRGHRARQAREGDGLVPLLLPRVEAPECDASLREHLSELIGAEALEVAIDEQSQRALLEACVEADACLARAEGRAEPDAMWPENCDSKIGQCTVVRLTMDESSDSTEMYGKGEDWDDVVEYLDRVDTCSEHPEQYITRTVWSRERILAARELVVQWECYRLNGTFGCGDYERPSGWTSPYSSVLQEGGFITNDDPGDLLTENRFWWMELLRYNPTVMTEGLLSGCWGSPEDLGNQTVGSAISDVTGGDCNDNRFGANRGQAEGPDDLVGVFYGEPADCATCLDGLDNNCNGLIDCGEPACARCFVGQGYGCGGGSQSPCTQGGCTVANTPSERRRAPGGGLLLLVGLASLGVGWRVRRWQ